MPHDERPECVINLVKTNIGDRIIICDYCNEKIPEGDKYLSLEITYYGNTVVCKTCFKEVSLKYFHAHKLVNGKGGKRVHFYSEQSSRFYSCVACDKSFIDEKEYLLSIKSKYRHRKMCNKCILRINKLLEMK